MELSKQKQTEAKKLNVTVQYLVMADLMAVGYSENDAYTIAYPENAALSVQQNNSIRSNILDSAKFKKLFDSRRSRVKDGVAAPVQLEEVELVSTEEVMKEILRSAKQQPVGSKEQPSTCGFCAGDETICNVCLQCTKANTNIGSSLFALHIGFLTHCCTPPI